MEPQDGVGEESRGKAQLVVAVAGGGGLGWQVEIVPLADFVILA